MDASLSELADKREIQRFIEIEQTRAYDRLMLERTNDRADVHFNCNMF